MASIFQENATVEESRDFLRGICEKFWIICKSANNIHPIYPQEIADLKKNQSYLNFKDKQNHTFGNNLIHLSSAESVVHLALGLLQSYLNQFFLRYLPIFQYGFSMA